MVIISNSNTITITGNIKKISDFQDIKNKIEPIIQKNQNLTINIQDSISLISTVIGYLNKLVLEYGINVQITVGDIGLYELLEDLNLIFTFKVKKALR